MFIIARKSCVGKKCFEFWHLKLALLSWNLAPARNFRILKTLESGILAFINVNCCKEIWLQQDLFLNDTWNWHFCKWNLAPARNFRIFKTLKSYIFVFITSEMFTFVKKSCASKNFLGILTLKTGTLVFKTY